MYDWLLFFHLLGAFALFVTVVVLSAVAFGAVVGPRIFTLANLCWDIGGGIVFVFGVWLALNVDGYELWDGWILAALVLFALMAEVGRRARIGLEPVGRGEARRDAAFALARSAAVFHWLRVAVVAGFVFLMFFKPGA